MSSASRSSSGARRSKPTHAAFTLVELLVAGAITAVLVTLMLGVTMNTLRVWNQSQGLLATNATARQVFDELSLDVQGMFWRADGQVWLAATLQRPQARYGDSAAHEPAAYPEKRDKADWGDGSSSDHSKPRDPDLSLRLPPADTPASLDQLRFGQAGVWLRFFTTRGKADDDTGGVYAVGYQLVRRAPKNHSPDAMYDVQRGVMTAAFAEPSDTTAPGDFGPRGYDLFYPAYHSATNINGALQSAKIRTTERKFSLGPDVIDFGLRIFEATTAAGDYVEIFPVNRRAGAATPPAAPFTYALCSDPAHAPPTTANYHAQLGTLTRSFSRRLRFEFMIRVLTPEGVTKLRAYETDPTRFGDQTWWDIAEAHSRVFTHTASPLATPL